MIALFLALSCKGTASSGKEGFQEFKLKADSLRLGSQTTLGTVILRIPRNWVGADSSTRVLARPLLAADSAKMNGQTLVMCAPETRSLMVGRAEQARVSVPQDFDGWAATYRASFASLHPQGSFSEARLLVNGIPLIQLFASDSLGVHFRLLLDVQPRATLDYLVPQQAVRSDLGAVESSIASLRKG